MSELTIPTFSTEAEAVDGVTSVINATANTASLTTSYPQGGLGFELPNISAPSVISEPTSQDSSFNTFNYLLSSQTQITTAQLQFMVVVTKEQWIYQDDTNLVLSGSFAFANNSTGVAQTGFPTTAGTSSLTQIGWMGMNTIADFASFYSQIQSIQIQLNDGTIQNVPAPYVALMSAANTHINVNNYLCTKTGKQYDIFESQSHDMGIRDSHLMEGRLNRMVDYSTWNFIGGAAQNNVYLRVPFREFMYWYNEPGRWQTSQTKLLIIINFKTPTPTINMTSVMYGPHNAVSPSSGAVATGNHSLTSAPITFTPAAAYLELNLYTPQAYLQKATEIFNISRPISTQFWTHQVIIDPVYQGKDLTQAGSWGGISGLSGGSGTRVTVRASGLLPKHLLALMQVQLTWASGWTNATPTSVTNWTRTKLYPGMIYISRLYLGGQDYGRNVVLDTLGYATLYNMSGWVAAQKFRRNDRFMQQMNRMEGVHVPSAKGWKEAWMDPRPNIYNAAASAELQTYGFAYYEELVTGPNGIFTSEDFSHETISQYRSEQIEPEYYIIPSFSSVCAGGTNLGPFTFADVVMNLIATGGTTVSVPQAPSAATANLYWILSYPTESTHGAGRNTSYAYIQYAGAGTQSIQA
jgi:hypothetical protein